MPFWAADPPPTPTSLVDSGFSCRELLRRAEKGGFDPSHIRWILLPHVHGDHLKGVEVLSRKLRIPVVHQ